MRVWIVNPFDNLPLEGNRPQRYWLMARAFARAGHEVTFWTSSFSHAHKAPRAFVTDEAAKLKGRAVGPDVWQVDGFRLVLIPTLPYRRNISLVRIRSHRALARSWAKRVESEEVPDVVIASSPPLGLCAAARDYCAARRIPFVVDVMDAWPETFQRVVPKFVLAPLARTARANYRSACVISAVAARYLDLVRSYGATAPARLFYHGIERAASEANVQPSTRHEGVTLVYAGNMSASYDLSTVITAVKELSDVTLELAGTGPDETALRALAANSPRIRFHGYLAETPLRMLLARADVGVVPMFHASCVGVPYKLADYAAAGLPILNSLEGETADLISEHHAGESYTAGSVSSFIAALARLRVRDMARLRAGALHLATRFDAATVYGEYVAWIESQVTGSLKREASK